jgi:toxin ParE1/3/4
MRPKIDVLWSPAAQRDLLDIWAYFAKIANSFDAADALISDITMATSLIAENPQGWRERTELMRGIRAVPIHPYLIFYRIADQMPEIVRVLHQRRDSASILAQAAEKLKDTKH